MPNPVQVAQAFPGPVTLGSAVAVGDFLAVALTTEGNSITISSLTDNLGNAYTVVVQNVDFDDSACRAALAYTKVTVPGTPTISVVFSTPGVGLNGIMVAHYNGMSGYEFDQADFCIGAYDPAEPGYSIIGSGTGMISVANTLIIGAAVGVSFPGIGNNILEPNDDFGSAPIAYASGGTLGAWHFMMSAAQTSSQAQGFYKSKIQGVYANQYTKEIVVMTFTKPLSTTKNFATQAAFRGGHGPIGVLYPSWDQVDVSLPWLPTLGNLVVVGALYNGSNALVPSSVTDSYGNVYTKQIEHYMSASSALFTCTVAAIPASGPFKVTVTWDIPVGAIFLQSRPAAAIAEYNVIPTTPVVTAVTLYEVPDPGGYLIISTPMNVVANSILIGLAGASTFFSSDPYPITMTPQVSLADRTHWLYRQLSSSQVNNRAYMGQGILMDRDITTAGSYDAEVVSDGGALGIVAIAVPYIIPTFGCPATVTTVVGQFYSSTITGLGGTPPYTFSISAGSLPPGLTLNSSTGVISGTATSAGSYTFTIRVVDSLGEVFATGCCPLDVTAAVASSITAPGCRTSVNLWQHSVSPQVEIVTDRNDDWSNCGTTRNKFFQGFLLDADTFGAYKLIQIRDGDTKALHAIQPTRVNHGGRQTKPYSFVTPFLAHSVRRETQDSVAWRPFGIQYIFEPTPEFTYTWKTQRTSHGQRGFHFIQRILFAYAASATVTLTITSFDGTSPAVMTLPSTGGIYQKLVVIPTFNKGLLYEYLAQSECPLQIWESDLEVVIGQWGRTGQFINYPLMGSVSGDKATI